MIMNCAFRYGSFTPVRYHQVASMTLNGFLIGVVGLVVLLAFAYWVAHTKDKL
ncbi:hypothetical protein Q4520_18245 [Alteromonas sp. 1_MG-2023]|uniref:hypothetical protein n=1 Tax=Alteromonas sp. 1_MG-2023 TaxID=3062669 RepID=UPI0026E36954|nr:hypothetical protein [Alteromonas sp. 1_MG-2023]MDO6477366.1 hypothetical protein [Alteromonas sp. 1_MG-2023]